MNWQPIETAPKDGTLIIAYTNDGIRFPLICDCVFDGGWWPNSWESPEEPLHPTYWMPIPSLPICKPKQSGSNLNIKEIK